MLPSTKDVGWISMFLRPAVFGAMALAIAVSAITVPAQAQTFTVLYSFGAIGQDGLFPAGDLIRDSAGNLYGTTLEGGASDNGTIFKLSPSGSEIFHYSFTGGAGGALPNPGLLRDAGGNLYGTTPEEVFKLSPSGTETILLTFSSATESDGLAPQSRLIGDASGNFYGTTSEGGASGQGLVFKLDKTGSETVLHSFNAGTDGSSPTGGLLKDAAGNLYGCASSGGAFGQGTIFKITP